MDIYLNLLKITCVLSKMMKECVIIFRIESIIK